MKIFITSRVSGRGNKIGPVFLSVRLLVSTLTAEPFEVRISNLIQWCTLTISRMSTMGKVIGQRSRSPAWKMWFFGQCYCLFLFCVTWYITMALSMVSWGHVTSQHDVMTAYDVTWRHRHYCITGHHQKMSVGERTIKHRSREVRQHWGVLFYYVIDVNNARKSLDAFTGLLRIQNQQNRYHY